MIRRIVFWIVGVAFGKLKERTRNSTIGKATENAKKRVNSVVDVAVALAVWIAIGVVTFGFGGDADAEEQSKYKQVMSYFKDTTDSRLAEESERTDRESVFSEEEMEKYDLNGDGKLTEAEIEEVDKREEDELYKLEQEMKAKQEANEAKQLENEIAMAKSSVKVLDYNGHMVFRLRASNDYDWDLNTDSELTVSQQALYHSVKAESDGRVFYVQAPRRDFNQETHLYEDNVTYSYATYDTYDGLVTMKASTAFVTVQSPDKRGASYVEYDFQTDASSVVFELKVNNDVVASLPASGYMNIPESVASNSHKNNIVLDVVNVESDTLEIGHVVEQVYLTRVDIEQMDLASQ